MKILKLLFLVITICFTTNTQAQLLKKLGKVAERSVERTLEKKVDQKTSKETEKTFDSTFNNKTTNKESKRSHKTRTSSSSVASSYTFTHKYTMQIQSGKHASTITYFLNTNENYIASTMDLQTENTSVISVMDMSKNKMVMFMNTHGEKTQMSMDMDFENLTNDAIEDQQVKITPTGKTKTLLNLTCHEYEVSGKDYHGNIWTTQDAGVSFSKAFYKAKSKKGFNQSWMSTVNGLTMEMTITDTSKRKPETISMTCIALEKENLNINSNDYKKML